MVLEWNLAQHGGGEIGIRWQGDFTSSVLILLNPYCLLDQLDPGGMRVKETLFLPLLTYLMLVS